MKQEKSVRVALVTGGASGIGQAVAERLAKEGVKVYVNYFGKAEPARKIAQGIAVGGGIAVPIEADVSKEKEVAAMFRKVNVAEGRLDILVNSAGVENFAPFLKMKVSDWDRVVGINLRGTFLCSQAAARLMAKKKRGGAIVNISSVHEKIPWGGYAHYCASKAGIAMLTKTVALELATHRIRVNDVCPGAISTPINDSWIHDAKLKKMVLEKIPAGRIGTAAEVAGAVSYLVSEEARYVTGTSLFIDGGMALYASFLKQG